MKKLFNKFLLYLGYIFAIAALLTVFANMIALGFYVAVLIVAVVCVAYFHLRTPNDN